MRMGKESECEGIAIGSGEVRSKTDDNGYRHLGLME